MKRNNYKDKVEFELNCYKWSRNFSLLDVDELVDCACRDELDRIYVNPAIFLSVVLLACHVFVVGDIVEHLGEGWIHGVAFHVVLNEVEIGWIWDDVVFPNGLHSLDEGMVDLDLMFVEDAVGFTYDVKQVLFPLILEFGEFGDLANAFVNEMLDFTVCVSIKLELVVDQDDEDF